MQLTGIVFAQESVHHREIADIRIGLARPHTLQAVLRIARPYHDHGRRLRPQQRPETVRVRQRHPTAIEVAHIKHAATAAAVTDNDHVRDRQERLAEHPLLAQCDRVIGQPYHRIKATVADCIPDQMPAVQFQWPEFARTRGAQAFQIFTGNATGLPFLIGEGDGRPCGCKTDVQRLLQHLALAGGQRQLATARPLQRFQPLRLDGTASRLGDGLQGDIQRLGQRLAGVGDAEMQLLRWHIALPLQADTRDIGLGDQRRSHVGVAQVNIGKAVAHHLQGLAGGLRLQMDGSRVALAGNARQHKITLGHQAQACQFGIARGAAILEAAHQRHRCFGILPGEDHATGALGGQRDIHHDVHLTGAGCLQYLGPIGITAGGHL
ncbi:hypothetical protein D3C71_1346950 [compost metagenome]